MIDLKHLIGKNIEQVNKLLLYTPWLIFSTIRQKNEGGVIVYIVTKANVGYLYTCTGKIHLILNAKEVIEKNNLGLQIMLPDYYEK